MANPYASPLDLAASMQPIRYGFGQTLTLDDHKVALDDVVPAKGLKRLKQPLRALLLSLFLVYVVWKAASPGEPLRDFVAIFMGAALCPFWIWLLTRFSGQRRERIARVHKIAESAKPTYGTITQEYLFDFDQDTAIRCSWDYFGRAFIFPEHLVLCVGFDPYRRVVIPWRNFGSPGEVHQVRQFIEHRLGAVVNRPPSDQQLTKMFAQREMETPPHQQQWPYEDPERFDESHWPHASKVDSAELHSPIECEVNLSAHLSTGRYIGIASLKILRQLTVALLPVLVALGCWLIWNYSSIGGWGFLAEYRLPNTLKVLPIIIVAYLFARGVFLSLSRRRRQQSAGLFTRLDDNGLYLSGSTFQAWFTHDAVDAWIIEDDWFGWTLKESGEQVRIPKKCYSNQDVLDRMIQLARQFSEAGARPTDGSTPQYTAESQLP
jgi:hypothetical protein